MTPEIQKQLTTAWSRKQAKMANLVQTMEAELERLQTKKVSPDFIQEKSSRVDKLLDIVNTADEIITLYRNELIRLRLENAILYQQLSDTQRLELIKQPNTVILKKLHETHPKTNLDTRSNTGPGIG
ncbi:hypothetical protein V8V91_08655 [Algoriphagus halophilus]|uniref:hypothetical protein n=1 Tax=Algoriphagus halophilus TaxID=226505 RepID=UPI00358F7841